MSGLTTFGIFHTAISLIAVASGAIALIRDQKISWSNSVGRIYVVTTAITCLTGFGIFQHGGFGKPHVLGTITLVVLGVAAVAGTSRLFVLGSPHVEDIRYSGPFFFHLVSPTHHPPTPFPPRAPPVA